MAGVGGDCIEWTKARDPNGYGRGWVPELKKVVLGHRWAVAQVLGWDAIQGKVVMHLCDNPSCINVDHLRVGTQTDNMRDAQAKGRTRGTFRPQERCKRGHEYTEENIYLHPRDGTRECRACMAWREARRRGGG